MNLTIAGKEYTLEFGIGFIREMDKIYFVDQDGFKFGLGVEMSTSYFMTENPVALYEVIKAATSHLKSKPSNADIEKTLADLAEQDKLSELFAEMKETMEKAPFLKEKIKKFKKQAKAQKD